MNRQKPFSIGLFILVFILTLISVVLISLYFRVNLIEN